MEFKISWVVRRLRSGDLQVATTVAG